MSCSASASSLVLGLGGAHVRSASDLARRPKLVRKAQELERQELALCGHRAEMLPGAKHHEGNGRETLPGQHVAEHGKGLLTSLVGEENVGPVEEGRRDGRGLDEVLDLDRLARGDVRLLEVLVVHDHELPLLQLVALGNVAPRDRLAGALVHPLVADGRVVAAVDLVKREVVGLLARLEPHRDLDEPEADGSRPHGAGRGPRLVRGCRGPFLGPRERSLPGFSRVGHALDRCNARSSSGESRARPSRHGGTAPASRRIAPVKRARR